jgi:phospholipase/lecithinase/hemolysin
MTRRWLRVAAALVLVSSAVPSAVRAQGPFTSLTVFGDSYSDTGNAKILAAFAGLPDPAPSPPFFMGRFSNGPVWVDYFAQLLGLPGGAMPAFLPSAPTGNYAVGGARSVNTGPVPPQSPSTQLQIARYLGANAGSIDPTGLFVLFAGGNDMRDVGALPTAAARQAATVQAALNVAQQAGLLAAAGAHALLVPTLGDVSLLPESQMTPGRAAALQGLTSLFNNTLTTQLATLNAAFPTTTFYSLQLDDLLTAIRADAAAGGTQFGILNVDVPCLLPGAPSCDVSLFYDDQHPTTVGHRIIANAALASVTPAVVPEPSTVALVGGGLLALGIAARRRRHVATFTECSP